MEIKQQIEKYLKLGNPIRFGPKTNVEKNRPGLEISYPEESISATIKIGEKHTAILSMSLEAYKELYDGAAVNVMTTKEFKKEKL